MSFAFLLLVCRDCLFVELSETVEPLLDVDVVDCTLTGDCVEGRAVDVFLVEEDKVVSGVDVVVTRDVEVVADVSVVEVTFVVTDVVGVVTGVVVVVVVVVVDEVGHGVVCGVVGHVIGFCVVGVVTLGQVTFGQTQGDCAENKSHNKAHNYRCQTDLQ